MTAVNVDSEGAVVKSIEAEDVNVSGLSEEGHGALHCAVSEGGASVLVVEVVYRVPDSIAARLVTLPVGLSVCGVEQSRSPWTIPPLPALGDRHHGKQCGATRPCCRLRA